MKTTIDAAGRVVIPRHDRAAAAVSALDRRALATYERLAIRYELLA